MGLLPLSMTFRDDDRVRALVDGGVALEGDGPFPGDNGAVEEMGGDAM